MDEITPPKVVYYPDGTPVPTDVALNPEQARVLGALVEKQVTTPEYYPLTLNALVNACNQTSSRDPVVSYDESTVLRSLEGLRDQKLAVTTTGAESRTPKYRHKLVERFELTPAELALVCLLLLRGSQTVGELRTRSGRLHDFTSLAEVEETLNALAAKTPQAVVTRLPRLPGNKESRFAHLLGGPVSLAMPTLAPSAEAPPASHSASASHIAPAAQTTPHPTSSDQIAELTSAVAELRRELADLRAEFAAFRKQFE